MTPTQSPSSSSDVSSPATAHTPSAPQAASTTTHLPAIAEGHPNHLWSELKIGDEASIERVVTPRDLYLFAHACGNLNPLNLPGFDLDGDGQIDTVAPSMWIGSLVSNVLGNILPGPGTLYRSQEFEFVDRVHVGETIKVSVRLREKAASPRAIFDTKVTRPDGRLVAQGTAIVDAPLQRVVRGAHELPDVLLEEHDHCEFLITAAQTQKPLPTAVVCPDDENSLGGALLAEQRHLIEPILIGSRTAIEAAARAGGFQLHDIPIIDIQDPSHAAAKAVEMVHEQRVRAIMKGNIHSDELLAHIVKKEGGLRTGRRISHVFALDVATLKNPIFISDAAINVNPDLATKHDIIQSAIDLARACGIDLPRVAILSAVETVNLNIPSSMDAAILAKMADRGQITGGIVDGPLAMDNAVNLHAALTKKLVSPVAGHAQVLIVPNIEAGNMLVKQLTFVSRAQSAGLVVGALVPVMLTSRADDERSRLASCALAVLYDYYRRHGCSVISPTPDPTDQQPAPTGSANQPTANQKGST